MHQIWLHVMVLGPGCAMLLQDQLLDLGWLAHPVRVWRGANLYFCGVLFGVGGDVGPGEDFRDGLPEVRGPGLVGGSVGKAAGVWVRGMAGVVRRGARSVQSMIIEIIHPSGSRKSIPHWRQF